MIFILNNLETYKLFLELRISNQQHDEKESFEHQKTAIPKIKYIWPTFRVTFKKINICHHTTTNLNLKKKK